MLDQRFFHGKLLQQAPGEPAQTKLDMAAGEAVKLKKIIGALRTLWRSSATGKHPKVSELKDLLKPSPERVAAREARPPPAA